MFIFQKINSRINTTIYFLFFVEIYQKIFLQLFVFFLDMLDYIYANTLILMNTFIFF
jgi:hypothetical protein